MCGVVVRLRSANFVKFRASGEATGLTTKPPNFSQVVFLTYFRCTHHLDTVIRDEGGARQGLRSVTPAGLRSLNDASNCTVLGYRLACKRGGLELRLSDARIRLFSLLTIIGALQLRLSIIQKAGLRPINSDYLTICWQGVLCVVDSKNQNVAPGLEHATPRTSPVKWAVRRW